MHHLLDRGLARTASLWPAIRTAYGWVHHAAHLLEQEHAVSIFHRRQAYRALLAEMGRERQASGLLGEVVRTFLKVTKSYWAGLFACYQTPDLPRTNNALEQFFGSARYHERRATGRKGASPAIVVRGAVRIIAAVATRLTPFAAADLAPADLASWRALRQQLDQRQATRRLQHRFRRDPECYLAQLEAQLLKSALPA